MLLLLIGTGILLVATLLLAVVLRLVLAVLRRKPTRFWWRTLFVHLVLAVVHLFVTTPAFLGWFGSRMGVQTRGDERAYAGPRIAADGTWVLQSRQSLAAEREGEAAVAPELRASAQQSIVRLTAGDGVPLRAFHVLPHRVTPRCSVVLVHGLFRGGLEIEPVAAMFRDLGAEVLMLELRNHGESGRAPATFGLRESRDVVAAVEWLRDRPEQRDRKVVLFGVSLGTAAVALAAARLPDLGGLVLDAPMDDLLDTAHRMLGLAREGRRSFSIPQPFRSLIFTSIELWSDFDFDQVQPRDALAALSPELPVLFLGGADDQRMPPAAVRALFEHLPTRADLEILWIRPGSGHGNVWADDPEGYRQRLAELLDLVR